MIFPRRNHDVWAIAILLAIVVLLPAAAVLWLTGVAVRHERSALREQMRESHMMQLQLAAATVDGHWSGIQSRVAELASNHESSELFKALVQADIADSVLVLGAGGEPTYPSFEPLEWPQTINHAAWQAAEKLEYVERDNQTASEAYSVIAGVEPDTNAEWFARLASARCLSRLSKFDASVAILQANTPPPITLGASSDIDTNQFSGSRFRTRFRNLWLDAKIRLLELLIQVDRNDTRIELLRTRLRSVLEDYSQPIESGQRLFAMQRFLAHFPDEPVFPTLAPLRTADKFWSDSQSRWQKTGPLLNLIASNHCVVFKSLGVVLIYHDSLQEKSETLLRPWNKSEALIRMVAPTDQDSMASGSVSVSLKSIAGRRLTLCASKSDFASGNTPLQSTLYIASGLVTIACTALIAMALVFFVQNRLASAQLKGDLASVVSHELRTPLSSVRVLVETLRGDTELTVEKQQEYLGLIGKENERLCRMVDSFLSYSRLQRDKRPFEMTVQSVSQIIDQSIATMGDRLRSPSCSFSTKVHQDVDAVWGDKDALITVLVNLLDNAVKFGAEFPEISVLVNRNGDFVRFEVIDNGIGMSANEQRRVFDHHFQVDTRLSRSHGGFGIGLSLVDKIVKAHGGDLGVESIPGNGSRFWFQIPRAQT